MLPHGSTASRSRYLPMESRFRHTCYPMILFDPIPGIRSGNIISLFKEISSFHHRWPLKSGLKEASNWTWAQSVKYRFRFCCFEESSRSEDV